MLNQISDTKGILEESPSPGLGISRHLGVPRPVLPWPINEWRRQLSGLVPRMHRTGDENEVPRPKHRRNPEALQ